MIIDIVYYRLQTERRCGKDGKTADGKKKVYVHAYETEDGKKVGTHYRSTPNTSNGEK